MPNIGSDLVGVAAWNKFKELMNDAHKTFSQKPVLWKRHIVRIDRFGEDPPMDTVDVPLFALLNYNIVRIWPIDRETETGEQDQQSVQLMLNKEYLRVNNWLTPTNYFDYNVDLDRFIIDGLEYEPTGDTGAAQAQDDDIFIFVVLKRTNAETGDHR